MDNTSHLLLVILGSVMFFYGAGEIAKIEWSLISEDLWLTSFIVTTAGLCMFTNSMLTLYLRARACESKYIHSHDK